MITGAATAAVALLALVLRTPPAAEPASGAYIGSAACAACHRNEAHAWEQTSHHLAMLPATPDAPLRAPRDGAPLVAHGDGLLMRAERLGTPDDVALRYALGCRHVEQYVGPLRADRLQALPIAFDVAKGEWFDL